jgi:hypothetical protein
MNATYPESSIIFEAKILTETENQTLILTQREIVKLPALIKPDLIGENLKTRHSLTSNKKSPIILPKKLRNNSNFYSNSKYLKIISEDLMIFDKKLISGFFTIENKKLFIF